MEFKYFSGTGQYRTKRALQRSISPHARVWQKYNRCATGCALYATLLEIGRPMRCLERVGFKIGMNLFEAENTIFFRVSE